MVHAGNFKRAFYLVPLLSVNTIIHINCVIDILEAEEDVIVYCVLFGNELPAPEIRQNIFFIRQYAGVRAVVVKKHQPSRCISFNKQFNLRYV